MAKKRSTRRSISVRGLTYQRLADHCEDEGTSVSGWLEQVIAERLDGLGVPRHTVLRKKAPTATASELNKHPAAHFTF